MTKTTKKIITQKAAIREIATDFQIDPKDVKTALRSVTGYIARSNVSRLSHSDVRGNVARLLGAESRRARVGKATNAALVVLTEIGRLRQTPYSTERDEVIYRAA